MGSPALLNHQIKPQNRRLTFSQTRGFQKAETLWACNSLYTVSSDHVWGKCSVTLGEGCMGLVGKDGNIGIRKELYLGVSISFVAPRVQPSKGAWCGLEWNSAGLSCTVTLEQAHAPDSCIFYSSLEDGRRASYFPSFERPPPCILHPGLSGIRVPWGHFSAKGNMRWQQCPNRPRVSNS